MPRRKKHPRLPNGYGSIRYLGGKRKNPYAVHPPGDLSGSRPPAICYVNDWYVGFAVLAAYRAGTYRPGDEHQISSSLVDSKNNLDALCRQLISNVAIYTHTEELQGKTFSEVYEEFYEWKYGDYAPKKLSPQSRQSTRAAYKNCAALHDRPFRSLSLNDLQECVNTCTLKSSSIELIVSLIKQMYRYAVPRGLCEQNYGEYVTMPDAEGDEHGVAFTDAELQMLWANVDDPVIEMAVIGCYSGMRISEYKISTIDLNRMCITGGLKTDAGKGRIVPIHSAILPLVRRRIDQYGCILPESDQTYRKRFYSALNRLGISGNPKHTPHDWRHTFSRLCEKYKVNENDRKRMLGHAFNDITNKVYGHRDLEDLRIEVEKIICDLSVSDRLI